LCHGKNITASCELNQQKSVKFIGRMFIFMNLSVKMLLACERAAGYFGKKRKTFPKSPQIRHFFAIFDKKCTFLSFFIIFS